MVLSRPLHRFDRMGKQRQQQLQTLSDAFRATRQVHDETTATGSCHATAEVREGGLFSRPGAHVLREAWGLTFQHLKCRLRSNVSRPESGAAGGQNQVDFLRPKSQSISNDSEVIGDNLPDFHTESGSRSHVHNRLTACVLTLTLGAHIASSENPYSNHCFPSLIYSPAM